MAEMDAFILKENVANLAAKLQEKHPLIPSLCREIHTAVLKNPAQMTLLSEEELAILFQGLEHVTGTKLMEAATSTGTGTKTAINKRIKTMGLDAFGG